MAASGGLIHARASRPDSSSIQPEERPFPDSKSLIDLQTGWALRVVVDLIQDLHETIGSDPPDWLKKLE